MLLRVSEKTGYEEKEILESDIKEFSLINSKTWTNKGTFKSWFKRYHVRLIDGTGYHISPSSFAILKEQLKGKYTAKKYTQVEYKGSYSTERKATDWTYEIK